MFWQRASFLFNDIRNKLSHNDSSSYIMDPIKYVYLDH